MFKDMFKDLKEFIAAVTHKIGNCNKDTDTT